MSSDLKQIIKENLKNISSFALFQGFPMKDMVNFLVLCEFKKHNESDILFEEGDQSTWMSILLNGSLKISKNKTMLCELNAPAVIGEIGLFTGMPRSATVTVVDFAESLIITESKINALIQRDPKLGYNINRNIILCLRNKINNDNQNLVFLQEELNHLKKDYGKQNKLLKKSGFDKKKTSSSETSSHLLALNVIPPKGRKFIRVRVPQSSFCYIIIGKFTVKVLDLSSGGMRIDLESFTKGIEKTWSEGKTVKALLFLKDFASFSISCIITSKFPSSLGIKFNNLSKKEKEALSTTIDLLLKVSQTV